MSEEFRDEVRGSFGRAPGSGRKRSEIRNENVDLVQNLIEEEDSSLSINQMSNILGISHSMVQRILEDDLEVIWKTTKWVPHTLTQMNKTVRMEPCKVIIESLSTRLAKKNLVTIDEKFFYCRNLKPRNKIGSWCTPAGDQPLIQTGRRKTTELKYQVIMAVSQMGYHYYKVLNRNKTVNSERYVQF